MLIIVVFFNEFLCTDVSSVPQFLPYAHMLYFIIFMLVVPTQ
jgi:hypothetical protein